jgi:hypothetical protein
MKKIKKFKQKYEKEERRHDKAYEKENKIHEGRHRKEIDRAIDLGRTSKKRK